MNKELNLAWQLVQNTGCNVFLTGKAGTGKTTFLREFYAKTHKRAVILAPTGIAAINANGSTLHSFFQLPFGPYIPGTQIRQGERNFRFSERKRKLIRSLDLVIIDEISMVRADLLDSVDAALRRFRDPQRPFGGVQLLLIGDLQQLAPVVKPEEWAMLESYYDTPYFFSSLALKKAGYVAVELNKVYRQSEETFINLLNKVRNNEADATVLQQLNARFVPNFVPKPEEGYIRLTTHNRQADKINVEEMGRLDSEPHTYKAEIWSDFPELSYPTAECLTLKVGAQVMFVKNDSSLQKRYFNGMIGTVTSMSENSLQVLPQGATESICVTPEQWEHNQYTMNEATKEIEEVLLGTFTQMPLKPAWAITVHKSQGLTFERAIIDVQYSFSHGQTYVALSRCRSLEGIVLSAPIPPYAIINDRQVVDFTRSIPEQVPSDDHVQELKRDYYLALVAEVFTFHPLRAALSAYIRHLEEFMLKLCSEAVAAWKKAQAEFEKQVYEVSGSFGVQYRRIITADYDYATNEMLQERCKKGAEWFGKRLGEVLVTFNSAKVATKNKAVAEREQKLREELKEQLKLKMLLLADVEKNGFDPERYLHKRALATIGSAEKKKESSKKRQGGLVNKSEKYKRQTYEDLIGEVNSYDLSELAEAETDFADFDCPDLAHEGLPY